MSQELVRHFAIELKEKDIKVSLNIADDYIIQASPHGLTQILTNLMQNAVRYSQATEITIQADTDKLVFADNGKGVPAKSLPYLFERFYRVDQSRNQATGGLGLGLAIAKELAESQGWGISAASGHPGLVFTITLNP